MTTNDQTPTPASNDEPVNEDSVHQQTEEGQPAKKAKPSLLQMNIEDLFKSSTSASGNLTLGGTPRADLMPPELRQLKEVRTLRDRWRLGALIALLLAVVFVGASFVESIAANNDLADANLRSQQLSTERASLGEVGRTQSLATSRRSGKEVAESQNVNYQNLLNDLRASLPQGAAITSLKVETGSPLKPAEAQSNPLEGARIGTISASVSAPDLGTIAAWVSSLKSFNGYADVSVTSVSSIEGGLSAEVTLHINDKRLENADTKKAGQS